MTDTKRAVMDTPPDHGSVLSPYQELLDIHDHLHVLVREKRRRLGLSLRAAATVTGVSAPTILRCEQGVQDVSLKSATILLRWIGAREDETGRPT